MDVFDLVAKISLDSSSYEQGLSRAKSSAASFGNIFKANIASDLVMKGFNGLVSGAKAAGSGLKSLVESATSSFGNYQQMVGGVQKLYGNMGMSLDDYAKSVGKSSSSVKGEWEALGKAQNTVLKNAKNAYRTAGMSANSYMETATQFSASLIKSLGGDTQKAADQTDKAMVAISDNFNTFGGNIEDVINAYKGFSKQNYTMLDNLKLGYGGTKTEMEKLISDANDYAKSIGQAGDLSINSFSDVVEAIDLIQQKQHIAGTTAREASTTLEGSMGQMQAAWENLKTSIGSGKDLGQNVSNLVDTIVGYTDKGGEHVKGYLDNLMPVIETALKGIGDLVEKAAPVIAEKVPALIESVVPPMLSALGTLASTIITNLPSIVQSIESALSESFGSIFNGDALTSKVSDLVAGLSNAISSILPGIITVGAQILTALVQGLAENADTLLNGAAQIITALGNGIIQNLPMLVDAAVQLLTAFTQYMTENQSQMQAGLVELVNAIVQGIIELAPSLVQAALVIVSTLGGALIDAVPQIVAQLPTFISELNGALADAWTSASPEGKAAITAALIPMFTDGIKGAVSGVKDIKDFGGGVKDVIGKIFGEGGAISKIKDFGSSVSSSPFGMLASSLKTVAEINIGELPSKLGNLGTKIKDLGSVAGSGALSGLKSLGSTLGKLGSTIGGGLLSGISKLGGLLSGTVIPAIASALPAIVPLLPVIAGVAAAIAAVIIVMKNWDKISKTLKAGWKTLKGVAKTAFGGVKDVITGAWDKVKSATSKAWSGIKSEVKKNGGGIKGVLKTVVKDWPTPWNLGFKALDKITGGKMTKIVGKFKVHLKALPMQIKAQFYAVKAMGIKLVKKLGEGLKGAASVGKNFVTGLWNGINNKVGWVVSKVKGFGKKVLKGLKDFFKIKSPSRVMRDEVGVNLALGVAKGIEKGTPKATKASDALAEKILKSVSKVKTVSVKVKATTSTGKATTKSVKKNQKLSQSEIDDSYIKAVQKQVAALTKAGKMTDSQQAALWSSVSKRVKKGSIAYGTAIQNMRKVSTSAQKDLLDKYQKAYDNFEVTNKKHREMNLAEQTAYWKVALKSFKKGTDQYNEVYKNYLSAKKSLKEQEKQANDTLTDSLKTAEKTYQDAIQQTIDKVNQRKESILSSFQLFEKYDIGTGVSKSTLMANLNSQLDALENWREQLADLGKRIGGTKLYEEIQEMGVQGYQQIVALNTMTDDEIKEYAAKYHERNLMAGDEAANELSSTVQKETDTAMKDYMKSVSDAWTTYQTTMSDMGIKVSDISKSVKDSVESAGKKYSSVLSKMNLTTQEKTEAITGTLTAGMSKVSKKTRKYGSDLVQNFIDGINSKQSDLTDAVSNSIAKVIKKHIGFSEPEEGVLSNFHTFAPDMIDLFTKGIYDNGYKIGEAFDKSLGLKDVASQVDSNIFAPTAQAAANSMQIAGLPNLTELPGQENRGNQPTNLHVTLKVGRTEFAKLVYQLGKEEEQRVGLNLATGAI
ncbi:MAG: hypothetical protein MSH24_06300 [Lachnospiraceae bacterium]|nr:hypothetical protein [Lachnospiraceae bacterium]